MHGPMGTGKSRALLEKAVLQCVKYSGARIALCRKTRSSMTQTVLPLLEQYVLHDDWLSYPSGHNVSRETRTRYALPHANGKDSELLLFGLDRPDKIMSAEFDAIYVFELHELTEHDWEMLASRLRASNFKDAQGNSYRQIAGDCNPQSPNHWVKRRIDSGRMRSIATTHSDNPYNPPDYVDRLKATFSGVSYERNVLGKWVAAEGSVYTDWNEQVNIIPSFPIPEDWKLFGSIDLGYRAPFVFQLWAQDKENTLYLTKEIYHTERTIDQHVQVIKSLIADKHLAYIVSDHDAGERAMLAQHGIYTTLADKALLVGVDAVKLRLRPNQHNGKPALFIFADALVEKDNSLVRRKVPYSTATEFPEYHYEQSKSLDVVKELPVKEHDHGLDALRYAVMSTKYTGPTIYTFDAAPAPKQKNKTTPKKPTPKEVEAETTQLWNNPEAWHIW